MAFQSPLNWPAGWPRAKKHRAAPFDAGMARTLDELDRKLIKLGITNPVISSDIPLRIDGQWRTGREGVVSDPGVAFYFTRKGDELCIPCDGFTTPLGNLRAIGLTLDYLGRTESYGTSQTVDAAFRGFKALPESIKMGAGQARAWYEVLQVSADSFESVVKAAHRSLIARYHPDNQDTGDERKFAEIQKAWAEYRSTL